MKKFAVPFLISVIWIFYRTNQFFEDQINSVPEVKSSTIQNKFFLPYPKNYELINEYEENYQEIKIIKTNSDIGYLNGFYQEILRSKNFAKDYEYENEEIQEFKYSKENQEITIILTKQKDGTSIMFRH